MKNYCLFFLTFLAITFITPDIVYGQKTVVRKSRTAQTQTKSYDETGTVVKIDLDIAHSDMVALIHKSCPNWTYGMPTCGPNGSNSTYQDFRVAGFCFLPDWEITSTNSTGNDLFSTDSIRAALVLWRPRQNQPDEIVLAGFGTDHNGILDALPGQFGDTQLRKDYTTAFPAVFALDGSIKSSSYGQNIEEEDRYVNSRELDFAFLEINRYWRLATATDYYINQSRPDSGIIIERAFTIVDYDDPLNSGTTIEQRYRTLSARPYPSLRMPNISSETATALEIMHQCPPGWEDVAKQLRMTVIEQSLMQAAAPPNSGFGIEDETKTERQVGLSLHLGSRLTNPVLELDQLNFELGILHELSKDWSITTRLGRYQTGNQTIDGVSLGARYLFQLAENRSRLNAYANVSLGYFDLPETNNIGLTTGAGLNYKLGSGREAENNQNQSVAGLPLELEAEVQYLNFNTGNNPDLASDLLSVNIGIRYLF